MTMIVNQRIHLFSFLLRIKMNPKATSFLIFVNGSIEHAEVCIKNCFKKKIKLILI